MLACQACCMRSVCCGCVLYERIRGLQQTGVAVDAVWAIGDMSGASCCRCAWIAEVRGAGEQACEPGAGVCRAEPLATCNANAGADTDMHAMQARMRYGHACLMGPPGLDLVHDLQSSETQGHNMAKLGSLGVQPLMQLHQLQQRGIAADNNLGSTMQELQPLVHSYLSTTYELQRDKQEVYRILSDQA